MKKSRPPPGEEEPLVRKMTEEDVVPPGVSLTIPKADWVWARKDKSGRQFPQTISHRGYKAAHPENTMRSFKGAVEVGTHALETDIHLSKDGVVVLSHDPDLKRCFGQEKKIIDCDWSYLSTLRTIQEPHEPMPRLSELLEYISHPERSHLWILLDIKVDNDADTVMRLIADTIKAAPQPDRPWHKRVVLGIWVAKYIPLCHKYLPDFPISHICFSTFYARQFLNAPNVSFNILQKVLFFFGPLGTRFIRDAKAAKRPVFTWTVNEANLMRWCIQKELDGVITDDPKLFNQICDTWADKPQPKARPSFFQWLYSGWLCILISFFSLRFRRTFPEKVVDMLKLRELDKKASVSRTLDP